MEEDLNRNIWKSIKLAFNLLWVNSGRAWNNFQKFQNMEDDLNGRRPLWKTTSMEDDLNVRSPQCRTTSMGKGWKLRKLAFEYLCF